jgi:hypothetical protein
MVEHGIYRGVYRSATIDSLEEIAADVLRLIDATSNAGLRRWRLRH